MGNKFGNYASEQEAIAAIEAEGFTPSLVNPGVWRKESQTQGNLIEAPRDCLALVKIHRYRVDGKYSPNGQEYFIYQHHFI
jgi:hypothetical protein